MTKVKEINFKIGHSLSRNIYSNSEREYLIQNYRNDKQTLLRCSKYLNRTTGSVQRMVKKLGLTDGTRNAKPITKEEIDYIRANWKHRNSQNAERIGNVIGRTKRAVITIASLNGISTKNPVWNKFQQDNLRNNYADKPIHELCRMFGKTRDSIYQQAYRMGLKRSYRNETYTFDELKYLTGMGAKLLHSFIDSGKLKVTHAPLSRKDHYLIHQADVKDFIKKYPSTLNSKNVDMAWLVDTLCGITHDVQPEKDPLTNTP